MLLLETPKKLSYLGPGSWRACHPMAVTTVRVPGSAVRKDHAADLQIPCAGAPWARALLTVGA